MAPCRLPSRTTFDKVTTIGGLRDPFSLHWLPEQLYGIVGWPLKLGSLMVE